MERVVLIEREESRVWRLTAYGDDGSVIATFTTSGSDPRDVAMDFIDGTDSPEGWAIEYAFVDVTEGY